MMQTAKLALRTSAIAAKTGTESPSAQYEETIEKILASINWSIAGNEMPERNEDKQKHLPSAVNCV
jgi:hypothetical protein